ncbi:hypothetical protein D3C95_04370 [Escherichia coli]|nr:hypothetical protein D3C95_04370 [Escherichia coli]
MNDTIYHFELRPNVRFHDDSALTAEGVVNTEATSDTSKPRILDGVTLTAKVKKEGCFDQLAIESTGISGPIPVAETFTFVGEDGYSLSTIVRLDSMVIVVDTFNFLKDYCSTDSFQSRGESLG